MQQQQPAGTAEGGEGKRKRRKTSFAGFQVYGDDAGEAVLKSAIKQHSREGFAGTRVEGDETPLSALKRKKKLGVSAATSNFASSIARPSTPKGALAAAADVKSEDTGASRRGERAEPIPIVKKTPGVQNSVRKVLEWLQSGPLTLHQIGHKLPKLSRAKVLIILDILRTARLICLIRHRVVDTEHSRDGSSSDEPPKFWYEEYYYFGDPNTVIPDLDAETAAAHDSSHGSAIATSLNKFESAANPTAAQAAASQASHDADQAAHTADSSSNERDSSEVLDAADASPGPAMNSNGSFVAIGSISKDLRSRKAEIEELNARLAVLQKQLDKPIEELQPAVVEGVLRHLFKIDKSLEEEPFYALVKAALDA